MLQHETITCPYCGEAFSTNVDSSAGSQEYIEDCQVCCRPILFHLHVDHAGDIHVDVRREDD